MTIYYKDTNHNSYFLFCLFYIINQFYLNGSHNDLFWCISGLSIQSKLVDDFPSNDPLVVYKFTEEQKNSRGESYVPTNRLLSVLLHAKRVENGIFQAYFSDNGKYILCDVKINLEEGYYVDIICSESILKSDLFEYFNNGNYIEMINLDS